MAGETLLRLPAAVLRDRLASGALRAAEVADAVVRRVAADDAHFAWFDAAHLRRQADALDRYRASGRPIGSLHGVPVAVADVVDTAGIPTANGTVADAGRVPTADAAVVERLKQAGALLVGKLATAEFGVRGADPSGATDARTGAAAAVASGVVPLAVGLESGGSVVLSAARHGVVGFTPGFGSISRRGTLTLSPGLDAIGVLAGGVDGAALLADALCGHDPADPATRPDPRPALFATATAPAPVRPAFAVVRTPWWARADAETRAAVDELAGLLGAAGFAVDLPAPFEAAPAARRTIHHAEMAARLADRPGRARPTLSASLAAAVEAGRRIPAVDYLAALDLRIRLSSGVDEIFDRCDAILTPAAPGPAAGAADDETLFGDLWTLCGLPAVTLPVFEGDGGRPMGIQLVGRRGNDGRLLRTARWLTGFLSGQHEERRHA